MTAQATPPAPADFDAAVDAVLDFMERHAGPRPVSGPAGAAQVPAHFFDGAEPMIPEWAAVTHRGVAGEGTAADAPAIFLDVHPRDLPGPLDVVTLVQTYDDEAEAARGGRGVRLWDGGFSLIRIRQRTMREVRGRLAFAAPYVVEATAVGDHPGLRLLLGRVGADARGAGRWTVCEAARRADAATATGSALQARDWSHRIQVNLGLAFLRPFQWRVRLRLEAGVATEFPTDPAGAREVFRLRDIPQGRTRRAALRHWVREHWRLSGQPARHDPGALEELLVRRHLSGATDFAWNGLTCRLTPSRYALQEATAAAEARARRRDLGTDRRARRERGGAASPEAAAS